MKKNHLIQRVNSFVCMLVQANDKVVTKVFNSQSAHFNGVQSWIFTDKAVMEFQRTWNRCVRRILHLPIATHTRYLPPPMETSSALDQIYGRFIKLTQKMKGSKNRRVKCLAESSLASPRGIMGSNMNVIAKRLQMSETETMTRGIHKLRISYVTDCFEQDCTSLSLVNELQSFLCGFIAVSKSMHLWVNCFNSLLR